MAFGEILGGTFPGSHFTSLPSLNQVCPGGALNREHGCATPRVFKKGRDIRQAWRAR